MGVGDLYARHINWGNENIYTDGNTLNIYKKKLASYYMNQINQ